MKNRIDFPFLIYCKFRERSMSRMSGDYLHINANFPCIPGGKYDMKIMSDLGPLFRLFFRKRSRKK